MRTKLHLLATMFAALLLSGCANTHSVVTTTQTGLGISVSENPSTGIYEARLGYFRNEFAYVPGNTNDPATVPDVMMELRMENIFKGGLVYQRLAVGRNAVMQPGATLLFAKSGDGSVDPKLAAAILQIPSPDAQVTAGKLPLAQAYQQAADKTPWDAAAKAVGYDSFAAFLTNPTLTSADVIKMSSALKEAKLIP